MTGARTALRDLEIRRATREDDTGVLALMRSSLGWGDDQRYEALFNWKHRQNPFGESPAWVALHEGLVVGFRSFMRWEFLDKDDQVLTAGRAVDTATDPCFRGLGIFRELTMRGVDELKADGMSFIFNTPNDQSRPGYLKMGWSEAARLPVGALPGGPRGLARMARAKAPAELWSQPTDAGVAASAALGDNLVAEALLDHSPARSMCTRRTPGYLAWRTSLEPLHYRLMLVDSDVSSRGGIVFRLRRRGDATEAVVVEPFVSSVRDLLGTTRKILRDTGADYALTLRTGVAAALPPLPRQGPVLATRPLSGTAPTDGWALTMADVELM